MNNILVAHDLTEKSDLALKNAILIASKFNSQIWLLHVADPEPEFVGYKTGPNALRDQVAIELRSEHKKLHSIAAKYKDKVIKLTPLVVQGSIVETILNQIEKLRIDMVFVGSKSKTGVENAFIGSVSMQIVKKCNVSVMVCR